MAFFTFCQTLSSKECKEVLSKRMVRLKLHQVLYETGETIQPECIYRAPLFRLASKPSPLSDWRYSHAVRHFGVVAPNAK
jgi:hypothetical protein